ncbi:MAG: leucine-rich repeat protein [Lachnospiraceae bacterium]|nr:leucine-rich repeat protein [Lachnospiraceae bacterium]
MAACVFLAACVCFAGVLWGGGSLPAYAQDFYGEGNVLIAVDMGKYAENENVSYPEGTMGTLIWGDDAPAGTSTRVIPDIKTYIVPDGIMPVPAPEYETETTYVVGDRFFFPYPRVGDPEGSYSFENVPQAVFPQELFETGKRKFWYNEQYISTGEDGTYYTSYCEAKSDGSLVPCLDFLEMECVQVTEYSTVWQYTGYAVSGREGFSIADYREPVNLTREQLRIFEDICDKAYSKQKSVIGDPGFEDSFGDRDKKAAFFVFDHQGVGLDFASTAAYYREINTTLFGIDCLVVDSKVLPGSSDFQGQLTNRLEMTLIHELNHYILYGCLGHEDSVWNSWIGEAFAQSAVITVNPEDHSDLGVYLKTNLTNYSSRMRMIFGIDWGSDYIGNYPTSRLLVYTLGGFFLRYVECMTTGEEDSGFWTEYIAEQTQEGSISREALDSFLTDKTGLRLDDWVARFMAAVVAGADEGVFRSGIEAFLAQKGIDRSFFFRPYTEYGEKIGSFDGAADEAVKVMINNLTAVRGGGTTYAYRNDAGGRIAITRADDNWYFFAVNMELPDPDAVISISSAEELAKIGEDDGYPISGKYMLTKDIDLGGEAHTWKPLGFDGMGFCGEFDGQGHTISGMYVDAQSSDNIGLFSEVGGNASVRNLTVEGRVTGKDCVGGIAGKMWYGSIENCESRVEVKGTSRVGGIAGYDISGNISGCSSKGTVSGEDFTGGIAGDCENADISGCASASPVSGGDNTGGMIGHGQAVVIEKCSCQAVLQGKNNVGGIIGGQDEGSVTGCGFSGTVTGEKSVGGIAGFAYKANMHDCSCEGTVTGKKKTGGIIGFDGGITLSGCSFAGTVTGLKNTGGIAGYIHGYCVTSDCHNTGTVTGGKRTGAITGELIDADLVSCTSSMSGMCLVGRVSGESYIVNDTGEAKMLSKHTDKDELAVDTIRILGEPRPITVISKKALAGNKETVKVTLSENVTVIGKGAFKGDENLKYIELTSSIKKVGKDAFLGIAEDAAFEIRATKKEFERVVGLLKASGVGGTVTYKRAKPVKAPKKTQ